MLKSSQYLVATIAMLASSYPMLSNASEPLKIATDGAYAPWSFTASGGKLDGYEIDLANEICARMKRDCEIVAQSFDGLIPALNAGKFDVIMAALSITPEREKVLDFSVPYGVAALTFLTSKSNSLSTLPEKGVLYFPERDSEAVGPLIKTMTGELNGKIIGVQTSTNNSALLNTLFGDAIEVREYKSSEELELDLQSERVDAAFVSVTAGQSALARRGFENFTFSGPLLTTGVAGIKNAAAFRKGTDILRGDYNEALEAIIAEGKLKEMSLKWFKIDVTPSSPDQQ